MEHPVVLKFKHFWTQSNYLSIVGRGELYPGDGVQVLAEEVQLEPLLLEHGDHPLVVVDGGVGAAQQDCLQLKCIAGKCLSFDSYPAIL